MKSFNQLTDNQEISRIKCVRNTSKIHTIQNRIKKENSRIITENMIKHHFADLFHTLKRARKTDDVIECCLVSLCPIFFYKVVKIASNIEHCL